MQLRIWSTIATEKSLERIFAKLSCRSKAIYVKKTCFVIRASRFHQKNLRGDLRRSRQQPGEETGIKWSLW